jgi:hypothetical protein
MTNKCIIYPLLSSLLPFSPITRSPPVVATVPITYLRFAFSFRLDVFLGVNILPSRGTMYYITLLLCKEWSKATRKESLCMVAVWPG